MVFAQLLLIRAVKVVHRFALTFRKWENIILVKDIP
jgi:hypothetical protein